MHAVALYVVALWGPGLLLGGLVGMRGWTLAAAAPLLTYAVAGAAGPAFATAGIRWSPGSAVLLVAALALLLAALRLLVTGLPAGVRAVGRLRTGPPATAPWAGWVAGLHRRAAAAGPSLGRGLEQWLSRVRGRAGDGDWTRATALRVAAATAAAALLGATVVWAGVGHLSAVPQDWDAAFHANGIRWIADTGDSSLFAMGSVNWFENGVRVFYPNAYHLVAALVLTTTGADVPTVLNAHTVLLPGMGALVVVALVHRFRGGAVLAAAAAASSVAITAFYDMLWRGPLLPFATGVVLMPLAAVLLLDLLDAGTWLARLRTGLLFAVGLVGLICLNPAMLFSAALFAAPAVVQRWAGRPRLLLREPALVLAAGLVTALAALPQLLGSLASAGGEPFDWAADQTPGQAIGALLTLSHGGAGPEWVLVVAAAAGLLGYRRLGSLRWIGVTGLVFGAMFVLTASSDAYWVNLLTRPWWNDRWRLIGLCVVPFALLAGHGVAQLQRWAAAGALATARFTDDRLRRRATEVTVAAGVLVGVLFVGVSGGLYAAQNIDRMRLSAPDGPVVSSLEVQAMHALATFVPPGQRVLNDRGDGSAWMYAIAGVLPVAGHYNASLIGPDTALLAARFNQYNTDPEVRAAVGRLGISYVMLDEGYVRSDYEREPGLTGLDRVRWLDEVYENRDAVIYRIRTDTPSRQ